MCFRNQQNLRLKRETCWGSGTTWEDISSLDAPPVSFPLKLRENQPAFAVNRIKFRLASNATRTNRIKFRLITKRLWRSLNLTSNLFGKELLPSDFIWLPDTASLRRVGKNCLHPTKVRKIALAVQVPHFGGLEKSTGSLLSPFLDTQWIKNKIWQDFWEPTMYHLKWNVWVTQCQGPRPKTTQDSSPRHRCSLGYITG